jgi:hypothetical protein
MMDLVVFDNIEFELDADALAEELHLTVGGRKMVDSFRRHVDEAISVARPKAAYKLVSFDKGEDNTVVVDGTTLNSLVLSHHLEDVYRIFPFVATCGRELTAWGKAKTDMMERFFADAVMDRALLGACIHLGEHLQELYKLENAGTMTPGSLDDWPIQEQIPLFEILGDIEGTIGVRLTEALMMDPVHSVSGIIFPSEEGFEECSLCPREDCPKRRAPYEAHLYETRYGGTLS